MSQTEVEQQHIVAAFTFELSKVETPAIRARMVSHLLNVDEDLGKRVGAGLRLKDMPKAAPPARPVKRDLPPSNALSILRNGPSGIRGRKFAALITDGVDAAQLKKLQAALEGEGAVLRLVAPHVGGVTASDKSWIDANEKLDGGPSVLFDAVAILISDEGARLLENESTARDFVADAFAHLKFMAYLPSALPLLTKAGVTLEAEDGCFDLAKADALAGFVKACGSVRCWSRAPKVKQI
jgi:catalase